MTLRSHVGLLRRQILRSIHTRTVPIGDRGPIVSFAFDDFPRSAWTVGGRILEKFSVRGTYYTAVGLMGTRNELGEQFCREDLRDLVKAGHELANHTFSHVSCRSMACEAFQREVNRGRMAIEDLTGNASSNFAFPFGDVTLRAKKAIGGSMASCRSVWGGVNGPKADLNLLRANSIYGDRDRFPEIQRLLEENERRRGWLIFYTHDIATVPSRFGCTPTLLDLAVSFSVRQAVRILTVAEVIAGLGIQRAGVERQAQQAQPAALIK